VNWGKFLMRLFNFFWSSNRNIYYLRDKLPTKRIILVKFMESEKHPLKNKTFASLDGTFHGLIEHTDEEIRAVQIKLKEI